MMTLAAVLLAVGALVFALAVRVADVTQAKPAAAKDPDEERLEALEESLQDLEFERRVGKLSETDYQRARGEMEREAAQLRAPHAAAVPAPGPEPAASGQVCPHCGARFPTPLKFCGECGQPMRRMVP